MKILNRLNLIRKKVKESKIPEYLYYFALLIVAFRTTYARSIYISFSIYATLINLFVIALLFIKVITEDYNKKEMVMNALLLLMGVFVCYLCGARNKIIVPLIVIGSKNVDFKKIIKLSFVTCITFVVFQGIQFVVSEFKNGKTVFDVFKLYKDSSKNLVLCKSPNTYASTSVFCIVEFLYLTDSNKHKLLQSLLIFVFVVFIYSLAQSTTSLIIGILLSMYPLLVDLNLYKRNSVKLKWITLIFVICFSVYMQIDNLTNPISIFINKCLTNRSLLSNMAFKEVGLHLIADMDYVRSLPNIVLDNLLVYYTYYFGIIFCICLLGLVVYFGFINKTGKCTDYMIIVLLIWCLVEHESADIVLSIAPLVCCWNFYNNKVFK